VISEGLYTWRRDGVVRLVATVLSRRRGKRKRRVEGVCAGGVIHGAAQCVHVVALRQMHNPGITDTVKSK
jgi:hypothetical protein